MKTIKQTILLTLLWIVSVSVYSNQIVYKANSKLSETTNENTFGFHTNAFDVPILSHTFINGTGMITFNGSLTNGIPVTSI